MTDAWDGRPERPERDGDHVFLQGSGKVIRTWNAANKTWWYPGAPFHIPATDAVAYGWRYLGPCLTPEEVVALVQDECASRYHPEIGTEWREGGSLHKYVAAREAAAAKAMRQACEARIRTYPIDCEMRPYTAMEVVNRDISLADEIAALPLPAAAAQEPPRGDAPCLRCDGGECQSCLGNER